MQNQTYGDFYLFTGDAKNGGEFAVYQLAQSVDRTKVPIQFPILNSHY